MQRPPGGRAPRGFTLLAAVAFALLTGHAAAQTCRAVFDAAPPPLNPCADDRRISTAFVGDILLHSQLQRQAYAQGWDSLWSAARPFLLGADIAVANLEGPVAPGIRRSGGQGIDPGPVFDNDVHSSYPLFNSHASLLPGLKALGIDAVSTANNHALDRFAAGAEATLAGLQAAGIAHTGTIPRGAPRAFATEIPTPFGPLVLLACSYSTNGVPDPHDQVLLCHRGRDELLRTIRTEAARPGVAGIVVLPHWGVEYSHRPLAADRALAAEMVAAGALAVIGTHPHVVQPWELLRGPAGTVPVAYSTGNFVSGQPGLARETGMLVRLELCLAAASDDLARTLGARATVASAGWVALRMVRGAGRSLAVADAAGIAATVQPAHDLIEAHVPGRGLRPRLVCDGPANGPGVPVLLQ